jgi:hypothetical protein
MHPKSTQISVDHQKLGTRKNYFILYIENYSKPSRVTLSNLTNLPKATKNFTKYLVFKHRNMVFNFWIKPIDACK